MIYQNIFNALGIANSPMGCSTGQEFWTGNAASISCESPIDATLLAQMNLANDKDLLKIMQSAEKAFLIWRSKTAPERGNIIRQYGIALRQSKSALGRLVSVEMGKSLQEGLGEVQEMIDICDFAVGLSRQLYGLQMHSERPFHKMYEQWHPLGIVGIISAFNFPVAVWSWNAIIAMVCGNVCIWKPSEKTPLTAIACQQIFAKILKDNHLPEGISNLIVGDYKIGEALTRNKKIALISATGSTKMGEKVGQQVQKRFGKLILELGGNNAIILSQNANLNRSIPAILFGAIGTAGQRCTSTRRLFIHKSIFEDVVKKMSKAYEQIKIGDPLDETNHMGPLIDQKAVETYLDAIQMAKQQGGQVITGGKIYNEIKKGYYVTPTIISMDQQTAIVKEETFAPILYVMKYDNLVEAIAQQNNVEQGLSSAIFTDNLQEAEIFLSYLGSDCGIANVNIGTSGAEIGGAFGGEKATGGGRESGSDAWKAYMRRQTCTVNYGSENTLAQGIKFEL